MWITTVYRLLRYGRLRPSWDLGLPRVVTQKRPRTPQVMFRAVLGRISSSAESHSTGPNERMGKHRVEELEKDWRAQYDAKDTVPIGLLLPIPLASPPRFLTLPLASGPSRYVHMLRPRRRVRCACSEMPTFALGLIS